MKKYFVRLMVVAGISTVIFAACKKDDDDDKNNTSPPPITTPTDDGKDSNNIFAFTAEEQQKINTIKTRYSSIQTNFPGGYFITVPTITPSYTIGEAKREVLQAGIDAINVARYIAGVPDDVELDAGYTELTQYGAVLLTAVNQLTHYPDKPEDMEQEFYEKAALAARSSNIATTNSPYESVFLYLDDSDPNNIDRVGHRRWILHPPMKKSGFGVGENKYGMMYAFDRTRGNVDYDYVTWPSSGVFPIKLINNNLAWSISVNEQKYGTPDMNKIEVTLKHLNSDKVWTFSNSTSSSTAYRSTYYNIEKGGYGIRNCIIFRPALDNSFKYKEGDVFQVTVSGLDKDLSYTVKMFSM
jgi:hypothetical protein